MKAEQKLKELGIDLPAAATPAANYVTAVRTGNLVFLAGHVSRQVKGKLGKDLTVEQGYQASREAAVSLLATLKATLGDLDKVRRVVKVLGLVNATAEFTEHPAVVNGCSDLLVAVFGDAGRHARSAVGAGSLPLGCAVEIEMVVEVTP